MNPESAVALTEGLKTLLAPLDGAGHSLTSLNASEWFSRSYLQKVYGGSLTRYDLYREDLPVSEKNIVQAKSEVAEKLPLLMQGYPIQYCVGEVAFGDHSYVIQPGVLIPRPETETWFEQILEMLRNTSAPDSVLEIGTGSGVLSCELLYRFSMLKVHATDCSQSALECASLNARQHGLASRLQLILIENAQTIFPDGLGQFDWIISNPPYLAGPAEVTKGVLAFEPHEALFEKSHLEFYRAIAERGAGYLKSGGRIFLEIPHERSQEILSLFQASWKNVRVLQDLNQRDRCLMAERNSDSGSVSN